jgi:hypothetical protein
MRLTPAATLLAARLDAGQPEVQGVGSMVFKIFDIGNYIRAIVNK